MGLNSKLNSNEIMISFENNFLLCLRVPQEPPGGGLVHDTVSVKVCRTCLKTQVLGDFRMSAPLQRDEKKAKTQGQC